MDADDLNHQVVRMRRGERFCDGYWLELLKDGVFVAVLRRAQALAAD
jgi:hypothetical protein